ncbi:MAG: GAF domain-containing sensor histidine kinase [Actinomycetota bacterium]
MTKTLTERSPRVSRKGRPSGSDRTPPRDATTELATASITSEASTDRLDQFRPAILAVRWATTGVSLALFIPTLTLDQVTLAWSGAVLTNTVLRTLVPLRDDGSFRHLAVLLAEIGLHVFAVIATGAWNSPLVLTLFNAVLISGFARGFGFAIRVGVASSLIVSAPGLGTASWGRTEYGQAAQWTTLLLLGGVVAGYSRRILSQASQRHSQALDRVARLSDANLLLANLHRVAQTLPASLDQGDVLTSTVSRLRSLIAHDSLVILVYDEGGDTWTVAHQSATRLGTEIDRGRFPGPCERAAQAGRLVVANRLQENDQPFNPRSGAGMYTPLLARDRLIGMLAVEANSFASFDERDREVLAGFVEPVALAIDNARWFDRIRTIGADEERNRIARDLHDRIGQSLAYLGFEIDRMIRRESEGKAIDGQLGHLRNSLRSVIVEVRDTLSDLRTDVSDERDFLATAEDFAERLAERSGLHINLDCEATSRLPILQEREMWRIAQEALVNVERHAEANSVTLIWRCGPNGALLEIIDDGCGLPERDVDGRYGRSDSFGIIGMRERAQSIGASLDLTSQPGEGTKVRCFLANR